LIKRGINRTVERKGGTVSPYGRGRRKLGGNWEVGKGPHWSSFNYKSFPRKLKGKRRNLCSDNERTEISRTRRKFFKRNRDQDLTFEDEEMKYLLSDSNKKGTPKENPEKNH